MTCIAEDESKTILPSFLSDKEKRERNIICIREALKEKATKIIRDGEYRIFIRMWMSAYLHEEVEVKENKDSVIFTVSDIIVTLSKVDSKKHSVKRR